MKEIQDELTGIGQVLHLIGESNVNYRCLTHMLEERIDNIVDRLDKETSQKRL